MALDTFSGEIMHITHFVNFLLTCENDQLARHCPSAEVIEETVVLLQVLQQKLPVLHAKMVVGSKDSVFFSVLKLASTFSENDPCICSWRGPGAERRR